MRIGAFKTVRAVCGVSLRVARGQFVALLGPNGAGKTTLVEARVSQIIDTIGLENKRKSYVVNLSSGQRQRLTLGIVLLNNPSILLLDEPTTGLDPNARHEAWAILQDLKRD